MNNSRRSAAVILMRFLMTKEFPQKLLSGVPERAFVQDMLYTAIRRLRTLRFVLGKFVKKWPKGELEALLYIGASQILFMRNIPDFAAVNETVEAAKQCENPNIAKVVNGTLRNLIRRKDEILSLIDSLSIEERESFPTELVRRWNRAFGEEATSKMCSLFNLPAETYIARKDGSFTVLERGTKVEDVPGYDVGDFIVQDPATRHAVELLDVKEGMVVLDACAAPGGKTIQAAWRGGKIVACEVNPRRRKLLEENIARTKVEVEVVSSIEEASKCAPFDAVLVDAPCSNTGVLRRRPDARWNWSKEKMAELVKLQSAILEKVFPLVKRGGRIVYSTCSIEPEENIRQVEDFLSRHQGFTLGRTVQSLPFETEHDGSFAAEILCM